MNHPTRILNIQDLAGAKAELKKIGADRRGIEIMSKKSIFKAVKVHSLSAPAANILKQEMLSYGGEAANTYHTIDCRTKSSDVLILGTLAQFDRLIKKLKEHAFGLPEVAQSIQEAMDHGSSFPPPLKIGGRTLHFGIKTYIMGVLNVTPDSFSDGGKFTDPQSALSQARRMLKEGADLIDVGGESTRPGAKNVPVKEELARVLPVVKGLKRLKALVSIDTRKAEVAEAALKAGAHMVNDISALRHDRKMAPLLKRTKAPVVLMHMQGTPRNMQKDPGYKDLIPEILSYLKESIAIAENAGILSSKIIVDPGIGFGKSVEHNLSILRELMEFKVLGKPLLIGTSRKSFIGKTLGLDIQERMEGTAATLAVAISGGVDIIRVHDVEQMKRVAQMTDAILRRS